MLVIKYHNFELFIKDKYNSTIIFLVQIYLFIYYLGFQFFFFEHKFFCKIEYIFRA